MGKVFRSILFVPLFLASCIFIGVLALAGMWAIFPNLIAASFAALFAVLIEGEVYKQNVWEGLKQLFRSGSFIEYFLLKSRMEQQAEKNSNDQSLFGDHARLSAYLEKLKHYHPKEKKNKAWRRRELQRVKYQKLQLLITFKDMVHQKESPAFLSSQIGRMSSDAEDDSRMGSPELMALLKDIRKKQRWLKIGIPTAILGGACSGLVGAFLTWFGLTLMMGAFGFTLSAGVLAGIIFPLAILIAASYSLMIYKTYNDIIVQPKFVKYKNKIASLLEKKPDESLLRCWIRRVAVVSAVAFVLALALLATFASCGTAWWAAKNGAILLPKMATGTKKLGGVIKIAAIWVRNIVVPVMGVSLLIFGLKNTTESSSKIIGIPKNIKSRFKKFISQPSAKVIDEWTNPFRVITNFFELIGRTVFFLLHISSIGMTGDHVGNVQPIVTASVGALNEATVDVHYIFEDHDDHSEGGGEEHDHSHSDLPGLFIKVVLAPFYLLSAFWHWSFRRMKKDEEKHVSVKDSLKWSFGIPLHQHEKKEPEQPQQALLTREYQLFSCDEEVKQELLRLKRARKSTLRDEKLAILEKLQNGVSKLSANEETVVPPTSIITADEQAKLAEHRHHFFWQKRSKCSPTKSAVFLEDFNQHYGNLKSSSLVR